MKIFTLAVLALALVNNILSGIRNGFDGLLIATVILSFVALCLNIAVLTKEKSLKQTPDHKPSADRNCNLPGEGIK